MLRRLGRLTAVTLGVSVALRLHNRRAFAASDDDHEEKSPIVGSDGEGISYVDPKPCVWSLRRNPMSTNLTS